jgi:hypothetical protein
MYQKSLDDILCAKILGPITSCNIKQKGIYPDYILSSLNLDNDRVSSSKKDLVASGTQQYKQNL